MDTVTELVRGQHFVRMRDLRVLKDYSPVRWQSFVSGMVAGFGNLVMECGIFLDSSAFMFRVTDPGDEGTTALLNVGNHLPSARRNIPKDLKLEAENLRYLSVEFIEEWLSFANGEVLIACYQGVLINRTRFVHTGVLIIP